MGKSFERYVKRSIGKNDNCRKCISRGKWNETRRKPFKVRKLVRNLWGNFSQTNIWKFNIIKIKIKNKFAKWESCCCGAGRGCCRRPRDIPSLLDRIPTELTGRRYGRPSCRRVKQYRLLDDNQYRQWKTRQTLLVPRFTPFRFHHAAAENPEKAIFRTRPARSIYYVFYISGYRSRYENISGIRVVPARGGNRWEFKTLTGNKFSLPLSHSLSELWNVSKFILQSLRSFKVSFFISLNKWTFCFWRIPPPSSTSSSGKLEIFKKKKNKEKEKFLFFNQRLETVFGVVMTGSGEKEPWRLLKKILKRVIKSLWKISFL